jgi:hypothetical protein
VIAVAAIVEGVGEVAALPILLRRINAWRTPDVHLQALPPIRVHRDRFLNRDVEFRRHLLLAAAKCGENGWITAHMCGGGCGETTDHPAFSARMDLPQAFARSRSFRKLCSEWARQMAFA